MMQLLVYLCIVVYFMLLGCEGQTPTFTHTDVTGNTRISTALSLPDSRGQLRHLSDFRGKVVLLFFGYTQCPDICPSTLAEMRQVMDQLGPDAIKLQVLFVSLDPERDTPELLAQYVPSFYPSFIGLRPRSTSELKQVTDNFKIYFSRVSGNYPDSYTIDHSSGSYLFDTQGRLRLFIRHGQDVALLTKDIRLLIDEGKK